ncbi:MAG: 50S ribosomal protein L22 [Euryarchaeota archaeon HGW-Euryarchaeota-1]|nr:MAG: 50S ribosomal protein L22 [Euryarchaeota archaeon HGW-Euryarchaeota-1]
MTIKSSYRGALEPKQTARIQIVNANVSPKYAKAVGDKIKGMTIKDAIKYLQDVAAKKKPLPLKGVRKVSHKKGAGIASGRYPKRTSETIVKFLKQLRTNAEAKMLDSDALKIIHFVANSGSRTKWQGYFKAAHGKRDGNPKLRTRQQHIEIIAGIVDAKEKIKKANAQQTTSKTKQDTKNAKEKGTKHISQQTQDKTSKQTQDKTSKQTQDKTSKQTQDKTSKQNHLKKLARQKPNKKQPSNNKKK